MVTQGTNLWDRLQGESEAAYARFLIFRNLGPARSVDAAYAVYGAAKRSKTRAPGNWWDEASRYNWSSRATAWDIAMLSAVGREVVTAFAASLHALALKTLKILDGPEMAPKSWKATLETIRVLNDLIDPKAIEALANQSGGGGLPRGSDGPPPIAGKVG